MSEIDGNKLKISFSIPQILIAITCLITLTASLWLTRIEAVNEKADSNKNSISRLDLEKVDWKYYDEYKKELGNKIQHMEELQLKNKR